MLEDPYAEVEEPPASRKPLPRWLWSAALLGVGIPLGFGLAYLWLKPADEPVEGPVAIAKVASDQLGESLQAVLEACGFSDSATNAREALMLAFQACTPDPTRARANPLPDPLLLSSGRTPQPSFDPGRQARPPLPGADPCLGRCNESHSACRRTRCGPEPIGGSELALWQQCLGRCLTENSRCRLTCR